MKNYNMNDVFPWKSRTEVNRKIFYEDECRDQCVPVFGPSVT